MDSTHTHTRVLATEGNTPHMCVVLAVLSALVSLINEKHTVLQWLALIGQGHSVLGLPTKKKLTQKTNYDLTDSSLTAIPG